MLLLVEHPHVLTLGVRGDGGRSYPGAYRKLSALDVTVHETGRGATLPYHGQVRSSATPSSI